MPTQLPHRWVELRPEDVGNLENELNGEVCSLHPLYGKGFKALYRRYPFDDVLFEVVAADYPLYVVHLTWKNEKKPLWPWVIKFKSLDDFVKNYERVIQVDDDSIEWADEKWRFFDPDGKLA